jgi:hypothetical protein
MADLRQNDSGAILRLTVQEGGVPIDVSAATCTIVLMPPQGQHREKPAAYLTDGTDGIIEYQLLSGDLNQAGAWYMQAHVVFATGQDFRSARVRLNVEASPV